MVKEREISSQGREAELWAFEMTRGGLDSVKNKLLKKDLTPPRKYLTKAERKKKNWKKEGRNRGRNRDLKKPIIIK